MLEQEGNRLCAGCGASNAAQASFCGVCGAVLLGEVRLEEPPVLPELVFPDPVPELLPAALPSEVVPPAPGAELLQEPQASAPAEAVEQKRCGWCSAVNPWTAAVCETCGARFPSPEQDAAFLRASEERLRAEEAAIDSLRVRRLRRNNWAFRWLFRW